MVTTAKSLNQRVDELIQSHKQKPLLSTTGTRAAIAELIWRIVGLEEAIREVALEIEDSERDPRADAGSSASRRVSMSPIK